MARRSAFSRGRPRSSGIARDWEEGPGGTAITQFSAPGSNFLGSGVFPTASELTVMRTRGLLEYFLIGTGGADGDGFVGAMGIGKCTRAAFDAGIASVPTPITEMSWDGWLFHQFIGAHTPDITFGGSPGVYARLDVDSKAMRKLDSDEILYAAFEVVEIGVHALNVFFNSRMLFQDSGR